MWISVDPRTKRLRIRFRVRGFSRQFYISTGLKDTKRNREIVRTKRDAIANDIALGRFDPTLKSYQPQQQISSVLVVQKSEAKYVLNLQELWEKYTEFKAAQLEVTTIVGPYKDTASLIGKLPSQSLEDGPKIRDYLLKQYSHFTAWDSLKKFSQCCKWAVDSLLIPDNPFERLQIKKPKRKSDEDDFKAFTLEQRDLIIQAFELHPNHRHYSSLIKFLFYTGCRPGEAFALTWADISEDCTRISFSKSCNLHKILKGTKNGKRRNFPCQSGGKLHQLLLSLKSELENPTGLVFRSITGCKLSTDITIRVWGEDKGVVKMLSQQGKLHYLKLYSTRHTFATWAIAMGQSPDKVAYWIGDDVRTVLKYYCHPNVSATECPDF